MKYHFDYHDSKLVKKISKSIEESIDRNVRFMELCGTHTMAVAQFGLKSVLPSGVELVSGPGCPVCVTATAEIDRAIELIRKNDVILITFGDLLRVPGTRSSLLEERASGHEVRVVYSPLDALDIAKKNKEKEVVFLGIGFETTAPAVAATITLAKKLVLKNFSVMAFHKLLPPAMLALLSDVDIKLDGFICPGHVSTIIGAKSYEQVASQYRIPCVIAGFEPIDILASILMLIKQVKSDSSFVEIQYRRAVSFEGNLHAMQIMGEVFEIVDSDWRGLGCIPKSGLKVRSKYAEFDTFTRFDIAIVPSKDHPYCRCGDVLKGLCTPLECKLFSVICNPLKPVGPCMVSQEGACAAWFKYY